MLEEILASYEDETFLKADGFDEAIIGVDSNTMRLIYSVTKCLDILQTRDGMEYSEAMEYFDFNTRCAFVGEQTPIWCDDDFEVSETAMITLDKLEEYKKAEKILSALNAAGVDNWEGYDYAMEILEGDE